MKHAGAQALKALSSLLARLRQLPIREKSPGVFYLRSQAFVHFHEDPAGIFADLRHSDGWRRYRVTAKTGQAAFLAKARRLALAAN